MKYYFAGIDQVNAIKIILIPKAKNKEDADRIVDEDTAMKGRKSCFWDKSGLVLSITDMKGMRKKIDKILRNLK